MSSGPGTPTGSVSMPMPRKGRGAWRGQHFLVSGAAARRIVEAADVGPADVVLEIGPGQGALTGHLEERARRVIAVEIDAGLAEALQERLSGSGRVEILRADALTMDFGRLPAGTKVVANLPYYISTAIIRRLLEARRVVTLMVLMLQKEVAERIVAPPGSRRYGILSVYVQLYADAEIVCVFPPEYFSPRPRVDSAVVRFSMRSTPRVDVADAGVFDRIVSRVFSMRRKTLLNSLAPALGLERGEARDLLQGCAIDPLRRPETLSLEELSSLCRAASRPARGPVAPSGEQC